MRPTAEVFLLAEFESGLTKGLMIKRKSSPKELCGRLGDEVDQAAW
jgi:hypothetical protein